jgi:hypothetical protein
MVQLETNGRALSGNRPSGSEQHEKNPTTEVLVQATDCGPNSSRDIRLPLYFRALDPGDGGVEHFAEVISIATWSFVMRSPIALKVGTAISIRMRIPVEISGSAFHDMRGVGRVVSECQLNDGERGYEVQID